MEKMSSDIEIKNRKRNMFSDREIKNKKRKMEMRFEERSMDTAKIVKLVAMVCKALDANRTKYLENFNLDFWFSEKWATFVDWWLEFASKRKAKVVSLKLRPLEENSVPYDPPGMFYRNSSLMELELANCRVAIQGRRIGWTSLTRLKFCDMELGKDVIGNILSGCPVLYSLVLECCWGFNRLDINSPSVGELIVFDVTKGQPDLKISAPFIQYLDITSDVRKIEASNISSVVEASIDIELDNRIEAIEWIKATLHIPELCLSEDFFRSVAEIVADGLVAEEVGGWMAKQRVSLTLQAAYGVSDKDNIVGMLSLLKFSPQLEKFKVFINLQHFDHLPPLRDDDDDDFSCSDYYKHLRTVEIGCSAELDCLPDGPINVDIILWLARILLRSATVLEKMSILFDCIDDRPEFMKIVREVNSYPKSSKQALIQIHRASSPLSIRDLSRQLGSISVG